MRFAQYKLTHFFTDIKPHGVAGTYDGAPVMKKMGSLLPTEQQTCHAHGTHLGICDIFYPKKKKKKTNENENENDEFVQNEAEDDDDEVESEVSSEVEDDAKLSDDESDITDTNFICDTDIFDDYDDISDESSEDESDDENNDPKTTEPLSEAESGMDIFTKIEKGPLNEEFDVIFKVRKIYKFISKSPVANGALQEEVKSQLGIKESKLSGDVRTRWNSMVFMLRSFVKVKGPLMKIWPEFNRKNIDLDEKDFDKAEEIITVLDPVLIACERICQRDATLYSADIVMKETITELENSTPLGRKIGDRLKIRYKERRNDDLVSLLKYLSTGTIEDGEKDPVFKMVPKARIIKKAKELMNRLFSDGADDVVQIENMNPNNESENLSFSERLERKLKNAAKPIESFDKEFQSLNKDMLSFQAHGIRPTNLNLLYEALMTIPPTSVEPERNFSQASLFLTKLRAGKMDPDTLDDLCFLRSLFLNNQI